jgi:hypothetical protein
VRQALERGGELWRGAEPSSEAGTHLRGTAADRLVDRCSFSGRGPFFVLGYSHADHVLGLMGMFICVLLFFENGILLGY